MLPRLEGLVQITSLGGGRAYRGTSLIRNSPPLGPYSMPVPRALWWSQGGMLFLMSEVPLWGAHTESVSQEARVWMCCPALKVSIDASDAWRVCTESVRPEGALYREGDVKQICMERSRGSTHVRPARLYRKRQNGRRFVPGMGCIIDVQDVYGAFPWNHPTPSCAFVQKASQ